MSQAEASCAGVLHPAAAEPGALLEALFFFCVRAIFFSPFDCFFLLPPEASGSPKLVWFSGAHGDGKKGHFFLFCFLDSCFERNLRAPLGVRCLCLELLGEGSGKVSGGCSWGDHLSLVF